MCIALTAAPQFRDENFWQTVGNSLVCIGYASNAGDRERGASIRVYDPANIGKGSETSKGRVITSVAAKLYTGRYIRAGAEVLETHSVP